MWYQWLTFIALIVIIPFMLGYFSVCIKKKNKLTKEQEKTMNLNIAKYTLFYWLVDLFYMSFIIDNMPCKYLFGGLVLLIVIYNLSVSFATGTVKDTFQRIGLLQDFIVGMTLTIYLVYIIPGKRIEINGIITVDNSLRDIITTIVAAVYGGLFTLVGVAWTIRKSESNRQEDFRRLENERKEGERRKYSPVFSVVNTDGQNPVNLILDNIENIDRIVASDEDAQSIMLQPIKIENSSKIEFYVYGILFNDEFYATPEKFLIKKDYYLHIYFLKDLRLKQIYEISLCIEDLIENRYVTRLNCETSDNAICVKGNGPVQLIGEKNE